MLAALNNAGSTCMCETTAGVGGWAAAEGRRRRRGRRRATSPPSGPSSTPPDAPASTLPPGHSSSRTGLLLVGLCGLRINHLQVLPYEKRKKIMTEGLMTRLRSLVPKYNNWLKLMHLFIDAAVGHDRRCQVFALDLATRQIHIDHLPIAHNQGNAQPSINAMCVPCKPVKSHR